MEYVTTRQAESLGHLKQCSKCREHKAPDEFYPRSDHPSSRPDCKSCVRARRADYCKKNPEKARASWRKVTYRKNFGITIDQYDEMYAKQNGECAICCTHQSELAQALAVDHDHETNKIRGLLCGGCNKGIGFLRESTSILGAAIEYLRRDG